MEIERQELIDMGLLIERPGRHKDEVAMDMPVSLYHFDAVCFQRNSHSPLETYPGLLKYEAQRHSWRGWVLIVKREYERAFGRKNDDETG